MLVCAPMPAAGAARAAARELLAEHRVGEVVAALAAVLLGVLQPEEPLRGQLGKTSLGNQRSSSHSRGVGRQLALDEAPDRRAQVLVLVGEGRERGARAVAYCRPMLLMVCQFQATSRSRDRARRARTLASARSSAQRCSRARSRRPPSRPRPRGRRDDRLLCAASVAVEAARERERRARRATAAWRPTVDRRRQETGIPQARVAQGGARGSRSGALRGRRRAGIAADEPRRRRCAPVRISGSAASRRAATS